LRVWGPSFEVRFEKPNESEAKRNFGHTNAITAIEIKTNSAKGTGTSLMSALFGCGVSQGWIETVRFKLRDPMRT